MSEQDNIVITIAECVHETTCALCHQEKALMYLNTPHGESLAGVGCQNCHGPGSEHIKGYGEPDLSVGHRPGVCGQCH